MRVCAFFKDFKDGMSAAAGVCAWDAPKRREEWRSGVLAGCQKCKTRCKMQDAVCPNVLVLAPMSMPATAVVDCCSPALL